MIKIQPKVNMILTDPGQLVDVKQDSRSVRFQHLRQSHAGVGKIEAGGEEGQHGEEGAEPHLHNTRRLLVGQDLPLFHDDCNCECFTLI